MKFQTGKLAGRQAAMIGILLAVLYFVFPASPTANNKSTGTTSSNGSQPAEPSSVVSAEGAGAGSQESVQQQGAVRHDLNLIVSRLPEPSEADIQQMISASPFFVTATSIPVPMTVGSDVAAQMVPDPVAAGPSRVEQLAADTKVNLLYSSSRGTTAAIINDEIVRPGGATKNGLKVDAIRSDGLDVRLSAE